MGLKTFLLANITAIFMGSAVAQIFESQQQRFQVVPVVKGLEHPWGMAFLPDGRMLVTERSGRLRLIENGALVVEPIAGLPSNIVAEGQGGLLDVALHPDFQNNSWVYLSYAGSDVRGRVNTEVIRGRLQGEQLVDPEVIFQAQPKTTGSAHYGSRLVFAPDGYLYISLGDRYHGMQQAQSVTNHLGALVRLNPDGSVPAANPFVNQAEARPEIYSYGHRNVQGLAVHPASGQIWAHEHGPRGGDEVNMLRAGANYGWPAITYGIDYSGAIISELTEAPGMEQPITYWDPSIAPSGMTFYTGNRFPHWQGDLFVGSLKFQLLVRLELADDEIMAEERLLEGELGRIRDVQEGPDGFLYILTDAANGGLFRLEPVQG